MLLFADDSLKCDDSMGGALQCYAGQHEIISGVFSGLTSIVPPENCRSRNVKEMFYILHSIKGLSAWRVLFRLCRSPQGLVIFVCAREAGCITARPGVYLCTATHESLLKIQKEYAYALDDQLECNRSGTTFRGRDESDLPLNRGKYKILQALEFKNSLLDDHLQAATVFKGTSSTSRNDLIQAIH